MAQIVVALIEHSPWFVVPVAAWWLPEWCRRWIVVVRELDGLRTERREARSGLGDLLPPPTT
jgi:hypothetical protein